MSEGECRFCSGGTGDYCTCPPEEAPQREYVTREGVTTEVGGFPRVAALLAEISGFPAGEMYGYAYVIMPRDPDKPLITGTNFEGRESVHYILGRAAEEWPE